MLAFALLVGVACAGERARETTPPTRASAPAPTTPRAAATEAAFTAPDPDGWGSAAGVRYLEVVRGGARGDDVLPLVVMIHGLGDVAHDGWLPGFDAPVRLVMPQAPTPYGDGFAWFEYRFADSRSEQLARGIADAADRLARAIESMRANRPTRGKPIVVGFSQGGMLSYALALHHPEVVRLAIPISGLLPEPLWPKQKAPGVAYPPIRALHGDADDLVPIGAARALVARLGTLGFDATLAEHAGVPHHVTPAMAAEINATLTAALRGNTARTP